jgi:hypothetical protein
LEKQMHAKRKKDSTEISETGKDKKKALKTW